MFDRRHAWFALGLYLAFSLVTQYQALKHFSSGCACLGYDPTQYMWAMVWFPHAILHGENPFYTHVLWSPVGLNMASNTTTPLLALVAWPLTALAGPIVSYNVMMLIAPVTGAWFAYRLCLYLTRAPIASIAGGWLYGFSTYAVTQLMGHLHLTFTFAAPALVLLALKRIDGVISARRFVILAALVLIAQLGCGTEMLLTVTCAGAIALVCGWLLAPASRGRIVGLAGPIVGAYAVMAIVGAPYIYYALTGPRLAVGWGSTFSADLLSFAIPSPVTWVGGHRFSAVSATFLSGAVETGTYLGLPLLAIVCAQAVTRWHSTRTRIITVTTIVIGIWSLGTTLVIAGHPTISLPFRLVARVPGLDQVLPVRVGVYVALGCALSAAIWVSGGRRLWLRWTVVVLAIVCLAPRITAPNYSGRMIVPRFFATDEYRQYLRPDEVVLPIPYGPGGLTLLWQADTDMYFRMASGSFSVPSVFLAQPSVEQLLGITPVPGVAQAAADLRVLIRTHDVGAIVVDPAALGSWEPVLAALALTPRAVGGIDLYNVPAQVSGAPSA